MDTATIGMILTVAGGLGGAALVTSGGIGAEVGATSVGTARSGGSGGSGMPGDDQTLPKIPWWINGCPLCPVILGAALAAGLWVAADAAMGRPTPQPALVYIAASVMGLAVGSGAAALYRGIASVFR